jgi:hypothetical protein
MALLDASYRSRSLDFLPWDQSLCWARGSREAFVTGASLRSSLLNYCPDGNDGGPVEIMATAMFDKNLESESYLVLGMPSVT